jgi:hypothetical protein
MKGMVTPAPLYNLFWHAGDELPWAGLLSIAVLTSHCYYGSTLVETAQPRLPAPGGRDRSLTMCQLLLANGTTRVCLQLGRV